MVLITLFTVPSSSQVKYKIMQLASAESSDNIASLHNFEYPYEKEWVTWFMPEEMTIQYMGEEYHGIRGGSYVGSEYLSSRVQYLAIKDGKRIFFDINVYSKEIIMYWKPLGNMREGLREIKQAEECYKIGVDFLTKYVDDFGEYQLYDYTIFNEDNEYEKKYKTYCYDFRKMIGEIAVDSCSIWVCETGEIIFHHIDNRKINEHVLPSEEELTQIKTTLCENMDTYFAEQGIFHGVKYELDDISLEHLADGNYILSVVYHAWVTDEKMKSFTFIVSL
jgi:hypothetical protein